MSRSRSDLRTKRRRARRYRAWAIRAMRRSDAIIAARLAAMRADFVRIEFTDEAVLRAWRS